MTAQKGRRRLWSGLAVILVLSLPSAPLPAPWASADSVPRCFGRKATIIGSPSLDYLRGSSDEVDVIVGLGGNDRLSGGSDDLVARTRDYICGGDGNDRIHDGVAGDRIRGGPGNDLIDQGAGRDVIRAGRGDDSIDIYGGHGFPGQGSGGDLLSGGRGNDFIWDGTGRDTLVGGLGDDYLSDGGSVLANRLIGGPGNDSLWARSSTPSSLFGGAGRDSWRGGCRRGPIVLDLETEMGTCAGDPHRVASVEIISGSGLEDVILGTDAAEYIYGDNGADRILGRGGDDELVGGGDPDVIFGGRGDDVLLGWRGDDVLDGGSGTNTNDGGSGTDSCINPDSAGGALNCE